MSDAWKYFWGEPDPDEPNELDDDYVPDDESEGKCGMYPNCDVCGDQ